MPNTISLILASGYACICMYCESARERIPVKSLLPPHPLPLGHTQDQRSTNLAVDNLSGATVAGRTVRVQHVKNYKKQKAEVWGP